MKKHTLTLFFISIITLFTTKSHAQRAYMASIDFEFSTPTNGYGGGITPSFSFDDQDKLWFSIGAFGGFEDGYYEDGLYREPSTRTLSSDARGDVITNTQYSGLKSAVYYGGKFLLNYTLILDSKTSKKGSRRVKNITDYMIITFGFRYTMHPATIGEYSVTSNDGNYQYYDTVEYEFHKAYSNFSPEIQINRGMFGVYYAYQKHPTDNEFHTIGLRINMYGGVAL